MADKRPLKKLDAKMHMKWLIIQRRWEHVSHTGNHMQLTRTTAEKMEILRHGRRYGNLEKCRYSQIHELARICKNLNLICYTTGVPPKNWFLREYVWILPCRLTYKGEQKVKNWLHYNNKWKIQNKYYSL